MTTCHRASAEFKQRFLPIFLQPGSIGGKIYGLPIAASARAMFYNKAIMTKAGFPDRSPRIGRVLTK